MKTINTAAKLTEFLFRFESMSPDFISTLANDLIWEMRLAVDQGEPFIITSSWAEYLDRLVHAENNFEPLGIVHCGRNLSKFYTKTISTLIESGRKSMPNSELLPLLVHYMGLTEGIVIAVHGDAIIAKSTPEFSREHGVRVRVVLS